MNPFYSHIVALAALALAGTGVATAQNYFWFDDGGTISPDEGTTLSELNQIVINYTGCQGTQEGLNPAIGEGKGWILGPDGSYDVRFADDYQNHQLMLTVSNGPIVKAGSYKLTIPEGAFNVYNNSNLICDAVSYFWTVDGTKDMGEAEKLTLVSSTPADGETVSMPFSAITLTFDRDITFTHSAFNAGGIITNLTTGGYIQLKPQIEGNVLTLTKGNYSSSDFMAGQEYMLELYADRVKAASDPSVTLPATTISFKIASEEVGEKLQVIAQIPAAGENIRTAGSVTFNRNLTAVDKSKVSLRNEKGHVVALSTVGRDGEAPAALIFNIDQNAKLQANTTYKLHLEAGAVTAGKLTNEEMDAAYWCIPVMTFPFADVMPNGKAVPVFSQMIVEADVDELIMVGNVSDIKVTGVSENQTYTYSVATACQVDGHQLTLDFDPVTPAMLAEGGALYHSVKVVIPEGTFTNSEGNVNRTFNSIVYVIEQKEVGEQTWTFTPASGTTVAKLGNVTYSEDEDGTRIANYSIEMSVSGENVYANIKDASGIKLLDYNTGATVLTFGRYDITRVGNDFSLFIGNQPVTANGHYELVIPADAIDLYGDEDRLTEPIHPAEDVTADWVVADPDGIEEITLSIQAPRYDLQGRRITAPHHRLFIEGGAKKSVR